MLKIFAPAKVNLALHITGQRDDGYHCLDSLVAFPDIGDELVIEDAPRSDLHITGAPGLPADDSNLVLRAAALFDEPKHITLHKNLPLSSGIGGGSADAAATLRALSTHTTNTPPPEDVLALGADVPACVLSQPLHMKGIGEQCQLLPHWPKDGYMLLLNPGVAVSTPEIFQALPTKNNASLDSYPRLDTLSTLCDFLAGCRNDLQPPAIATQPVIGDAIAAVENTTGCLLARMSGSGATVFGIYPDAQTAGAAQHQITRHHPDWWLCNGALTVASHKLHPQPCPHHRTRATT